MQWTHTTSYLSDTKPQLLFTLKRTLQYVLLYIHSKDNTNMLRVID